MKKSYINVYEKIIISKLSVIVIFILKISAFVVHPGLVKTDMTVVRPGNDSLFTKVVGWTLMPFFSQEPEDGANSSLFAATFAEAKSSEFYVPNGFLAMYGPPIAISPPKAAKDLATAEKLWEVSEQLTKVTWT